MCSARSIRPEQGIPRSFSLTLMNGSEAAGCSQRRPQPCHSIRRSRTRLTKRSFNHGPLAHRRRRRRRSRECHRLRLGHRCTRLRLHRQRHVPPKPCCRPQTLQRWHTHTRPLEEDADLSAPPPSLVSSSSAGTHTTVLPAPLTPADESPPPAQLAPGQASPTQAEAPQQPASSSPGPSASSTAPPAEPHWRYDHNLKLYCNSVSGVCKKDQPAEAFLEEC